MTDCLFCKIASGEIPSQKIYEDENVFAFLDINPVSPGHALVIPKEHAQMLLDASDDSVAQVMQAAKYIAAGILQATGATGFNLVANNHPSAGQLIEHLHLHIIPRTKNDGIELIHGKSARKEELENVAQMIKEAL